MSIFQPAPKPGSPPPDPKQNPFNSKPFYDIDSLFSNLPANPPSPF